MRRFLKFLFIESKKDRDFRLLAARSKALCDQRLWLARNAALQRERYLRAQELARLSLEVEIPDARHYYTEFGYWAR
jgi:hypothetical protein